jgi:hypothetical protein
VRRRVFHFFCAGCLLIFAAGFVLCVRGLFVGEALRWAVEQNDRGRRPPVRRVVLHELFTIPGGVGVFRGEGYWSDGYISPAADGFSHRVGPPLMPNGTPSAWDRANFRWGGIRFHVVNRAYGLWEREAVGVLPFWVFLPVAIPPMLWWRSWRKQWGRGFEVESAQPTAAESKIAAATNVAAVKTI